VALTREVVRAPAVVEYQILGTEVGYVTVRHLHASTAGEVQNALNALRARNVGALVLDLRGNGGGVLSAAIEVAERFLPTKRLITYTEGRVRTQNMRFTAHATRPIVNLPLAVLVDDGTAAGAEMVAAALQSWGRATLVGMKSMGRTTIQSTIPLSNGAQLHLTTARWYTPKGALLLGGLTPDVEAPRGAEDDRWFRDPERDPQLRRAVEIVAAMRGH
jgi:carboxyl-terminal processing protease